MVRKFLDAGGGYSDPSNSKKKIMGGYGKWIVPDPGIKSLDEIATWSFPAVVPAIPADQATFEALSWGGLAVLSNKCAADGTTAFKSLLGFTKNVNVTGLGSVKAKLIGLNHDTDTNGKVVGFTFQLTDGLGLATPTKFFMNDTDTNAGGWAASKMRTTNLPLLKSALPANLTKYIKKVKKKSSTANSGTTVSETEDDLFCLSLIEGMGTAKDSTNYPSNPANAGTNYTSKEGTQYEWYAAHNTLADHIIHNKQGDALDWWLRTITVNEMTFFYSFTTTGALVHHSASGAYLPAVGFCI